MLLRADGVCMSSAYVIIISGGNAELIVDTSVGTCHKDTLGGTFGAPPIMLASHRMCHDGLGVLALGKVAFDRSHNSSFEPLKCF
jgi:hypothetical protein